MTEELTQAGVESDRTGHTLRFGVMCSGTTFPEWQARCLKELLQLASVSPALLMIDDSVSSGGILSKLKSLRFNQALFQIYSRYLSKPRAMKSVDMAAEFANVPQLRCKVIKKGKFSEYFADEDLETIKEHNLDFILRFGFNIIRGKIHNRSVARYGVWSFHHDDETTYRGSPPGFWEVYKGDPISGAILQRLTNRLDGGIVLKKGFFPTVPYSYTNSLSNVLLDSAIWPAQVCKDILNGNADYIDAEPSKTDAPIYKSPNNFQMVWFLLKQTKNFASALFDHFFRHEEWNVGIVRKPINAYVNGHAPSRIEWLPAPAKGQFIADPFGVSENGKVHVFCEKFDYKPLRGDISRIEVDSSGTVVKEETSLAEPYHLAYPYLFEHEGVTYCIPETAEYGEVRLYRDENFPSEWTYDRTLISDYPGVDVTVFQHNCCWWLMSTRADDGKNHKLFIWHAENVFGPWKPHSLNPVKQDIRSSRPAGTPFMHEGRLYRPAQDCSETYGGRITINEVTSLTSSSFEEKPVRTIEPDVTSRYSHGVHTISNAGEVTLIDGKRYVFSMSGFRHSLSFILRKIKG